MSAESKKKNGRNIYLFILGSLVLVMGITLILAWWPDVVALFKGSLGFLLALAGLFILYMIKNI
ncbi:MAG: hypothetical protein WC552_08765 [Candidatus Omnitrophota bacterium]